MGNWHFDPKLIDQLTNSAHFKEYRRKLEEAGRNLKALPADVKVELIAFFESMKAKDEEFDQKRFDELIDDDDVHELEQEDYPELDAIVNDLVAAGHLPALSPWENEAAAPYGLMLYDAYLHELSAQ